MVGDFRWEALDLKKVHRFKFKPIYIPINFYSLKRQWYRNKYEIVTEIGSWQQEDRNEERVTTMDSGSDVIVTTME
jgi:hypothetical protein